MSKSNVYHAYFSQTSKNNQVSSRVKYPPDSSYEKQHVISNIYLSPEGNEVEVTEVCREKKEKYNFEDMEYRGIVVKWVRCVYRD